MVKHLLSHFLRFALPLLAAVFCSPAALAEFNTLHTFDAEFVSRWNGLAFVGEKLYGTNAYHLYTLNPDGSDFEVLHTFAATGAGDPNPTNGARSYAPVTYSGSKLYGSTGFGGEHGYGTVYSINPDGSDFTILHSFDYAFGAYLGMPHGRLPIVDGKLYGTTYLGGSSSRGLAYSLNLDGSDYQSIVVRNYPLCGLAYGDGVLYGTDQYYSNGSYIFSLNADLSNYQEIAFLPYEDPQNPDPTLPGYIEGDLTLKGTKLFGIGGYGGGPSDNGTIFSLNTDGTGFEILHDFADPTAEGAPPQGRLTLRGSKLYGVTYGGGAHESGTLFSMNTDGSAYHVLYDFEFPINPETGEPFTDSYGEAISAYPIGDLIIEGSILYGMTGYGGDYGHGTIYSLDLPPLGDTDQDYDIDTADLTVALQNFTGAIGSTGGKWAEQGDTDGDGDVDTADLTAMLQGFTGAVPASLQNSYAALTQPVPEPGSLVLLLLGGLGILAYYRCPVRP